MWTLAVGPSELTKNLLQELSKDMTMRWGMVTDKAQEFLVVLCAGHRKVRRLAFRVIM